MKKISLEDAWILGAIKTARFFVRVLPIETSLACAKGIGWLVSKLTKRSQIAYKNIRMVYAGRLSSSQMKRLAVASIQNLAVSAVEMLRIPDMTLDYVKKHFTVEGEERIRPYLDQGRGLIFLTGHFGSWELLNIVSALKGYPLVALARVQKHPRSDQYLNDLRRSTGSQVIHKGMPVREILKALKTGKIVGILSDQDGGRNGRWVRFMGRLSSIPQGAATFSLRTGAPIVPAFIFRDSSGNYLIELEQPLGIPQDAASEEEAETTILQQFASILEKKILKAPEQWLWAHRRWKSSPDRVVLILSDGKAGHLNQSLAVLESLKRERSSHDTRGTLTSKTIAVDFKTKLRAKAVSLLNQLFQGHLPARGFFMKWSLTKETYQALESSYADVVISCGSSVAAVNQWVKEENSARSVVVMKPSLPLAHFDAVIAPKHDGVAPGRNVFATEGALASLKEEDLELEGAALAAELGLGEGKKIGVLLGGDAGPLQFDERRFADYMRELTDYAQQTGAQLLITTSRRTPAWAERLLKKTIADKTYCPLLLIANERNRANVVAGILGVCDAALVSAESISMMTEAVYAGKPVVAIRPWQNGSIKRKYEHYLSRLKEMDRISEAAPSDLKERLRQALHAPAPAGIAFRHSEQDVLDRAARKVIN